MDTHPFAVLLRDYSVRSEVPCIKQQIRLFDTSANTLIAVQRISRKKVGSYGIVDVETLRDSAYRIKDIVEKPSLGEAPSNIAAIGPYVFEPKSLVISRQRPRRKEAKYKLVTR